MTKPTEFTRIFSPRATKAVKAILLLKNGAKYGPTAKEVALTLEVLKAAVDDIARLYGALPADVPSPGTEDETRTSAGRIDRKMDALKRSPFAHGDVDTNVRAIPENQVTAYASHLMARMCEKFETDEVLAPPLKS